MKNKFCLGLLALLLCVAGCSSLESRAQKLQLGMTQPQAVQLLGSDYTVAAARMDGDVPVQVIKYNVEKSAPLYLYFRANKLVQWGDMQVLQAMPDGSPPSQVKTPTK